VLARPIGLAASLMARFTADGKVVDMDRTTWLLAAHDLSLAAWFGGHWMGAVGLNGATIEVHDHTQRIRVADAGWFRWAPVVATAALTHVLTARALGRLGAGPRGVADAAPWRTLRVAVTAGALVATIETGLSGQKVVRAGDVPVATAVTPIAATPDDVAAAQRRLRVAQWLVPLLTGSLWVLNAAQQRST
jgi:hypothetical protein